MASENPIPSILERITWEPGRTNSSHPLRECTKDCYGRVHFDTILALRLRDDPPIGPGCNDARGLLLAREILNSEELGVVIVRSVEAVAVAGEALFVFEPTVKAWLEAHPQFSAEDLLAQGLRVKYVRELH